MKSLELSRFVDEACDAYQAGTWIIGSRINELLKRENLTRRIDLDSPRQQMPMFQAKEQLKASLLTIHPFVPNMPPVATLSLWIVGPFTVGFSDNHEDYFAAIDRFRLKLSWTNLAVPFVDLTTKRMQELRGYRSILAPVLGPLESKIVDCVGAKRLKGDEIAASIGHEYDGHFKGVLSKLTASGALRNLRPGYVNPQKYKPRKSR